MKDNHLSIYYFMITDDINKEEIIGIESNTMEAAYQMLQHIYQGSTITFLTESDAAQM